MFQNVQTRNFFFGKLFVTDIVFSQLFECRGNLLLDFLALKYLRKPLLRCFGCQPAQLLPKRGVLIFTGELQ
jgi:hypothetical protein